MLGSILVFLGLDILDKWCNSPSKASKSVLEWIGDVPFT